MNGPESAPKDSIFWRLHKFINEVSETRDTLPQLGITGNAPPTDAERGGPTHRVSLRKYR